MSRIFPFQLAHPHPSLILIPAFEQTGPTKETVQPSEQLPGKSTCWPHEHVGGFTLSPQPASSTFSTSAVNLRAIPHAEDRARGQKGKSFLSFQTHKGSFQTR